MCDLAETYGIYDMQELPLPVTAALAAGLQENSRVWRRRNGVSASRGELLLAAAVDKLSLLLWIQTEDGRNGVNRPESVFRVLAGELEREESDKPIGFDSVEDFKNAWRGEK